MHTAQLGRMARFCLILVSKSFPRTSFASLSEGALASIQLGFGRRYVDGSPSVSLFALVWLFRASLL